MGDRLSASHCCVKVPASGELKTEEKQSRAHLPAGVGVKRSIKDIAGSTDKSEARGSREARQGVKDVGESGTRDVGEGARQEPQPAKRRQVRQQGRASEEAPAVSRARGVTLRASIDTVFVLCAFEHPNMCSAR